MVCTMDIWCVNLCSTEGFDCPGIDLDICPSNRVQDSAGIVGGVNLRCIAMS